MTFVAAAVEANASMAAEMCCGNNLLDLARDWTSGANLLEAS